MSNELLLFIEAIFVFGSLLLVKKFLGKYGLIAWVAIVGVLANIQVTESVNLFGLSATLGNVLFASSFLATDIISECYGKKYAKKAVFSGIGFMIFWVILSQITLLFQPNEIDMANGAFQTLFTISIRTTLASVSMYALANFCDVILFEKLSKKMNGKHLWFRNNVCTILCNCLENFGFIFLAFGGIYEIGDLWAIALTTCAIEIIIAIFDTPFAYIAKRLKTKGE